MCLAPTAVGTFLPLSASNGTLGRNWFSLLTNTWALAGSPKEYQAQALDSLEQNIFQLAEQTAESGVDDSMQEAIESLTKIVMQMKDEVVSQERLDQRNLNKKHAALRKCLDHYRNHHRVRDQSYGLRYHAHRLKHVFCKVKEVQIFSTYNQCISEQGRCSNTSACCAPLIQPNRYCLEPGVAPSPLQFESECQRTSRCNEESVRNKLLFFRGKLEELDSAELACEQSRKGCEESYNCSDTKIQWTIQHSYCNLNQTEFEDVFCHAAAHMEREWDHFENCLEKNKTQLIEMEQHAIIEQRRRKQEFRALARIFCLLHVLHKNQRKPEKMLKHCLKHESKPGWRFSLPSERDGLVKHYVPKCRSLLWAPGTPYFHKAWYPPHRFPSELMPKTLRTTDCAARLPTNHCRWVGWWKNSQPSLLVTGTTSKTTPKRRFQHRWWHHRFHRKMPRIPVAFRYHIRM